MVSEQRRARMAEMLSQQAELYRGLFGLAQRKRESLIAGNLKDLDRLLEAEQVLFWRAGRMDEEVSRLLADLTVELGLTETVRLEQVPSLLGEDEGARCRDLLFALDEVLRELTELNRTNSQLIVEMLAQVESSLQLLTALGTDGMYDATGGQQPHVLSRLVDSQA